MFTEAIEYPFAGDEGVKRVLVGGLLVLFAWLVIPLFAVAGYMLQTLGASVRGDAEPPALDDWGTMIVDGLKATVVGIAYGIVPFVALVGVVFVTSMGSATAAPGRESGMAALFGVFGLVGILASLLLGLVLSYVVPIGLANLAVSGKVSAAFDFGTIGSVATSGDYIVAWLLAVGVGVALNVASFILQITIVGVLALPWLIFYATLVQYNVYGAGIRKAMGGSSAAL